MDLPTCPQLLKKYQSNKLFNFIPFSVLLYWFFSATTATIGFMYDDISIILGSMLISPISNPIKEASLAFLSHQYFNMISPMILTLVLIIASVGYGFLAGIYNDKYKVFEVPNKTMLKLTTGDYLMLNFLIGFMFGIAITYSILNGHMGPIIGFNLAVALMPPLVVAGIFLSHGWLGEKKEKIDGKENIERGKNSLLVGLINLLGVMLSILIGFAIFC